MQETWVRSLSREDPLEKEMETHSSVSCLGNPTDGEAWGGTVCEAAIELDMTYRLNNSNNGPSSE